MTVTGDGDCCITPEGVEQFVFDRPVIPSVLVETPSQGVLQAASHEQIEAEVQEREIQMEQEEDEEELEGEDEDSDEDEGEQKWFVPAQYLAVKETPECEACTTVVMTTVMVSRMITMAALTMAVKAASLSMDPRC
eukprot:gene961-1477_t